jgi:tetratricopeptide (TPR) repeat protein
VRIALLAVLLVVACSCSRAPRKGPIVVLRFENLTGNDALDWIGRGVARQMAAAINGATPADSHWTAAERERAVASGVTRILHGYLSKWGGSLRLHAEIEDTAAHRSLRSADASGPISAGVAPLAAAVARQLDPDAQSSLAKNDTAMAAYITGIESPDPSTAADSFNRAISADPDFGGAYLSLLENRMAQKDRPGAERALAMARARGSAISQVDRARLEVLAARHSGDRAALSKSLEALSRLTPYDSNLLRALAESQLAARRFGAAIATYQKALTAVPGDATLLNALGYAQAYGGDLDASVKSLLKYERLHPSEANPLDSIGDVYFYWDHFSDAEKYYRRSYQKDASFLNGSSLLKASRARLMSGDPAGAETIFAEYEAARRLAADPMIGFARAQWDFLRGKRQDAIREMTAFLAAAKVREAAALADCQLTVWLLETGDRDGAARHGACRFLLDPKAASSPNPAMRAYSLLLARDFPGALTPLRDLDERAMPNVTEMAPVLLAWAMVETGHFEEAEKYLKSTPVPPAPGPDLFSSLVTPRIFDLRARVAEKKGDTQAAARNRKLYQVLSASGAPARSPQ